MAPARQKAVAVATILVMALGVAAVGYLFQQFGDSSSRRFSTTSARAEGLAVSTAGGSGDPNTLNLSDTQLASVKVEPVEAREFPVEKEAVGGIDFNEDMETQVFTPYQGRIIALFAAVGDDVKKGQTLFTIDSPDLLAAEFELDRRRRCAGADHPQFGAPSRAV